MSFIEYVIIAAIVLILGAAGYSAIAESKRPNIEIKKDDWSCTKSEQRTTMMLSGKVLIPITKTVCLEYTRIGG